MSDRVRYAGITFVGNTGFPSFTGLSCAVVYSDPGHGADTIYPVNVPRTTTAKWRDRVKNWSLSTDITFDTGMVVATLPNGAMDIGVTNATRELDLLLPATRRFFSAVDLAGTGPFSEVFFSFDFSEPVFNDLTDDWPKIEMSGQANDTGANLVEISQTPDTPDGTLAVSIDGVGLPNIYWQYTPDRVSETFTGSFITLTPTEFWPYAALDSSPIYDTATGGQLQSPLN